MQWQAGANPTPASLLLDFDTLEPAPLEISV
jgi:hypothetical protein